MFGTFSHQGSLGGNPATARLTTSDPHRGDGKTIQNVIAFKTICSRMVCGVGEDHNEHWKNGQLQLS